MKAYTDMTGAEIHDALASDLGFDELAGDPYWEGVLHDLVKQARICKPDLTPDEANHIWDTMREYLWGDR